MREALAALASARAHGAAGLREDDARAARARSGRAGLPAAAARVAARSIARRIAEENRWTLGAEVGFQVRFERRFSKDTRLLVATEGVLTRRLQSDPLLSGFRTIVLDEFHERSLHADLALASRAPGVARAAGASRRRDVGDARSRSRLALPRRLSGDRDRRAAAPGRGALRAARVGRRGGSGDALASRRARAVAFLAGAPEIRRAQSELGSVAGALVLPLHGTLSPEEQDRALAPSTERKVILATNVAETSLTVEGVTDVIDGGQHKVLRYDPERALDRLELERIPADAAAQRAGRAGRTGPGPRAAALGRARPAAAEPRAGDRARGPRAARARGAGLGRRPARVSSGSRRRRRTGSRPRWRSRAAGGERETAGSPGTARRCSACRCTRVSRASCCRRAGGARAAACAVLAEGWRPRCRRRADDRLGRALGRGPDPRRAAGVRDAAREL
jgi:hypothetical protein